MEKKAIARNPFEVAQLQFDIAADALKLEDGIDEAPVHVAR